MEAACSGHTPQLPRKALFRRELGRGGESRECLRRKISSLLQMRRARSWRESMHAIPRKKQPHSKEKGDHTFPLHRRWGTSRMLVDEKWSRKSAGNPHQISNQILDSDREHFGLGFFGGFMGCLEGMISRGMGDH